MAVQLQIICSQVAAKTSLKFVDYKGILKLNRPVNSSTNRVF